jgi:hypothetical protein
MEEGETEGARRCNPLDELSVSRWNDQIDALQHHRYIAYTIPKRLLGWPVGILPRRSASKTVVQLEVENGVPDGLLENPITTRFVSVVRLSQRRSRTRR